MNIERLRRDIDSWFYYNRPEFETTREFVDNIINNELKDEIIDLEPNAMKIVVREYLRINYGNVAFDIIQEVLDEDEFEKFREILDGIVPFLKQGEYESIIKEVAKKRIIEKYGSELHELLDNQPLYEEIRVILREREKEWEGVKLQ